MLRCTKNSVSSFALLAGFFAGLGLWSLFGNDAKADTTIADLCVGTGSKLPSGVGKGGCTYSDGSVPVLAAEVCWDGSQAHLRGNAPCPSRQVVYFAKYGEVVDPSTGQINAFAPVPDACSVVPCGSPEIFDGPIGDDVACCDPETDDCVPVDANGKCAVGDITWCKDLEPNGDGTVTCHE